MAGKKRIAYSKGKFGIGRLSQNNSNVAWELTTLVKHDKRIILIAEEGSTINIPIKSMQIIYYKTLADEEFLFRLQQCLNIYSDINSFSSLEEANRLFSHREYNAAAISAFRYLEQCIRESKVIFDDFSYRVSLGRMLQELYKKEVISDISEREIREYIYLRNELVHTNVSIEKKQAKSIIEFVKRVANNIAAYDK